MGWWRDRTHGLLAPLALLPLAAFPPLEWSAVAWMALTPLLLLIRYGPGGGVAWLAAGWGYGALYYAVQFSWLSRTLLELGGVPAWRFVIFSVAGISFLALFPALVIAGSRLGWRRFGLSPFWTLPLLLAMQDALLGVFPFGGMPWGSLSATQTGSLAAQWLAPLAGGSAVVLLIALVNGGWAWAARNLYTRRPRAWLLAAAMGAATLLLAPSWPSGGGDAGSRAAFSVLLVPGNFPAGGAAAGDATRLRGFIADTLRHMTPGEKPAADSSAGAGAAAGANTTAGADKAAPVKLVIWPESAAGGRVESGEQLAELSQLATVLGVDIVLGSGSRRGGRDYNSAYLVLGGQFNFRRYDKRRLVPFGEYIPAGFRWFFATKVTSGEQDYLRGEAPPVLNWRGRKLGLGICFESILPGHVRAVALHGAELMLVIANDQWITPAARRQHLWLSALRGLEIGRDLLFVSNGGWSAHLSGGRIIAAVNHSQGSLRTAPELRRGLTPWVRWGYGPLALLLAACLGAGLILPRFNAWLNEWKMRRES
jgi:apolipoprotein N-acyltransferase